MANALPLGSKGRKPRHPASAVIALVREFGTKEAARLLGISKRRVQQIAADYRANADLQQEVPPSEEERDLASPTPEGGNGVRQNNTSIADPSPDHATEV